MRRIVGVLLGSFLFGSVFFIGHAQTVELEPIVITGSYSEVDSGDTARVVDVVSADDIGFSASGTVADLIGDFTSVDLSDYGSAGAAKEVRLRGSSAAQVLLMVDGRPVNNPNDGSTNLNGIPLDNINRIEILHGPGSSLYGSAAMGGVVNVITKSPPEKGQTTEFLSTFGTYRTYREKLTHGARIGKFGYLLSGGYDTSEGHRDNAAYSSKDFNSKLEYEFMPDNKLAVNCGFYRARTGVPGSLFWPSSSDQQIDLKKYVDAGWKAGLGGVVNFSAKAYYNYDRLEFDSASKYVYRTHWSGLDLRFDKDILPCYSAAAGFNYTDNHSDTTVSAKHAYDVRAGYIENNFDLFDRLRLSLNGRWDDYSNFGTQFNPGLSFLCKITSDFKVHGSLGSSFRAPTFNDLYYSDSYGNQGNPGLQPEKSIGGDFGIDARFGARLKAGITYYRNAYHDLIQWSTDPVTFVSEPFNIGSAVIDGLEFTSVLSPWGHLDIDFGYSFTYARDNKTGNRLIYRPDNKYDFGIKVKKVYGFDIALTGEYYDKSYADTANTIIVKGHFTAGLDIEKKFNDHCTVTLAVDNAFDKEYQFIRGYPMPGTAVTGGIKLSF